MRARLELAHIGKFEVLRDEKSALNLSYSPDIPVIAAG
jgi:hypothetical protein